MDEIEHNLWVTFMGEKNLSFIMLNWIYVMNNIHVVEFHP
jgi:hypothetical protein